MVGTLYNKNFAEERSIHKYKNYLRYFKERHFYPKTDRLLLDFIKFIDRS